MEHGGFNLGIFDEFFRGNGTNVSSRINFLHVNLNYELYLLKNFISFQVGPSLSVMTFTQSYKNSPGSGSTSNEAKISLMFRLVLNLSGKKQDSSN